MPVSSAPLPMGLLPPQQAQQQQMSKAFLSGSPMSMGMGMGVGVGMPVGIGLLGGPGSGLHHSLCKPKKMRKPRTSTPPCFYYFSLEYIVYNTSG